MNAVCEGVCVCAQRRIIKKHLSVQSSSLSASLFRELRIKSLQARLTGVFKHFSKLLAIFSPPVCILCNFKLIISFWKHTWSHVEVQRHRLVCTSSDWHDHQWHERNRPVVCVAVNTIDSIRFMVRVLYAMMQGLVFGLNFKDLGSWKGNLFCCWLPSDWKVEFCLQSVKLNVPAFTLSHSSFTN